MDLIDCRYNVLYDNVLWHAALRAAAELARAVGLDSEASSYLALADGVHIRLNLLLWAERGWDAAEYAEKMARLKELRLEWYMVYHNIGTISSRPFYLPYAAFREYGDYFDLLGNLLAILLGVADAQRTAQILRYLRQVGADRPFPYEGGIYSPIFPGDKEWRDYYRSRNLNLPHHYHNGGTWPFIGGFYVATLVCTARPIRRASSSTASRAPISKARSTSGSSTSGCTARRPTDGLPEPGLERTDYLFADAALQCDALRLLTPAR